MLETMKVDKRLVRDKETVFRSLMIMLDYYKNYLDLYKDVKKAKLKFLETYKEYYEWLQGIR